ncbi:MAG: hypothetical protein OEL83_17580 [Desulforhopalus sp.]|nr:hypothetical protein [Desulforhopalus sp.]
MKNWKSAPLAILFVLFIFTPATVMITGDKAKVSFEEKRQLAELPALKPTLASLQAFPAKFDAYFNDHFGLRSTFVRMYSQILVTVFRTSPKWLVVIGKEGWLFFAGDNELVDFTGFQYREMETLQRWKQVLEDRKNWLAAQGIHYLFLIPPNKSMIYPEFLPERISSRQRVNTLERFQEVLASDPAFPGNIDLRPVLLAAKEKERIYHKSDTHWNAVGGYAAYSAIMTHLGKELPGLQPLPREEFEEKMGVLQGGDMSLLLNLRDLYHEPNPILVPPQSMTPGHWQKVKFETMKAIGQQRFRTGKLIVNGMEGRDLTAIFICDSFGSALSDLLAMHFKKIIRVNDARFEDVTDLIRKEKPDVVIDLNVARRMDIALGVSQELLGPMVDRQLLETKPTLDITDENLQSHLLASEDLRIDKTHKNGIALEATGGDPQLLLSAGNRLSSRVVNIKCVIDSPVQTTFAFYYKTPGDKAFSGKNLYTAQLERGENTIHFRIYTPIRLDALRIDPGSAVGQYVLRQFTLVETP